MHHNEALLDQLIKELALGGALQYSPQPIFRVRNWRKRSRFYIRWREAVTHNPHLQALSGTYLASYVRAIMGSDTRRPVLIGIPAAGTALSCSTSTVTAFLADDHDGPARYIAWRQMHKVPKPVRRNQQRWVDGEPEGPPDASMYAFMTIDNAVTTGRSFLKYALRLEEDRYPTKTMPHIFFVDRELGGYVKVLEAGYPMARYVTSMTHVVDVLVEGQLWPEEAKRHLEREIHVR